MDVCLRKKDVVTLWLCHMFPRVGVESCHSFQACAAPTLWPCLSPEAGVSPGLACLFVPLLCCAGTPPAGAPSSPAASAPGFVCAVRRCRCPGDARRGCGCNDEESVEPWGSNPGHCTPGAAFLREQGQGTRTKEPEAERQAGGTGEAAGGSEAAAHKR